MTSVQDCAIDYNCFIVGTVKVSWRQHYIVLAMPGDHITGDYRPEGSHIHLAAVIGLLAITNLTRGQSDSSESEWH